MDIICKTTDRLSSHCHCQYLIADTLTEEGLALKKITISCYIITSRCYKGATAINKTWGRRCDHIRFLIPRGKRSCNLPTIYLPNTQSFSELCSNALTFIQNKFQNESDWTLVATDNNYVIIENVRFMLKEQTPEDPVLYSYYEEYKFSRKDPSAIYLFSKSAMTRYSQISGSIRCNTRSGRSTDLYTVLCMEDLQIKLEVNGSQHFNAAPLELGFNSNSQNVSKPFISVDSAMCMGLTRN